VQLPHISLSWTDALDIVFTAYVVYVVLLLIRGTRAVQILQGIALLVILRLVAQYFHLWTMLTIFNGLLIASGVAIPVVFQPELRRALARLGTGGFLEGFRQPGRAGAATAEVYATIARTAAVLSRSGTGAIIVIERATGLEEFVESGRIVDSLVSTELLLSIFTPKAPLHDGAAIVRGARIIAAGCFLPLSERSAEDRRIGTRHRAALGISEQTDAVALLVSEETGDIELARDGRLMECGRTPEEVLAALNLALTPPAPSGRHSMIERVRTAWTRGEPAADGSDTAKLRP
jgi:diadenylate cyclase